MNISSTINDDKRHIFKNEKRLFTLHGENSSSHASEFKMFLVTDLTELSTRDNLVRSMFSDRAKQFVLRHKWPLFVNESGLEVDEYDDLKSSYCIVSSQDRHMASLRLRSMSEDSMVEDHFPSLWRDELRTGVEITRFCAAPGLCPSNRLAVVSDLLLGLCRHAQAIGLDNLFGIVFPSTARVIRQAGWDGAVLCRVCCDAGQLLLVRWLPSEFVAWEIQERREFREELLMQRTSLCRAA